MSDKLILGPDIPMRPMIEFKKGMGAHLTAKTVDELEIVFTDKDGQKWDAKWERRSES